ncbi:hypothetical protein [Pilimelia terevasa]|uniref:hypothetical protein n=1 Tax=Pilimelia terevasa TaxID=53372 RepID=UPI00166C7619|nr:hypothetical protein [Pilimelia terevasa]
MAPGTPAPAAPAAPADARAVPGPLPAPGDADGGPQQAVQSLLPAAPEARTAQLGRAIGWLAENLDRPQLVATGAAQLGPAAAALGVRPEQTAALAALLADAVRGHEGWGPREQAAWQATADLVARWVGEGAAAAAYAPAFWTGTVVARELRRPDLAVLLVRTFLPYPYVGGQHAVVETAHHRDVWAPCWIAGAPRLDNTVELHVRAESVDDVAAALAGRVAPGDQVRLRPPEGGLAADPAAAGLLVVGEGTGAAAVRGLLEELRLQGDTRPAAVVHWVDPGQDSYDRAALAALGDLTVVDSAVALAELVAGLPAPEDLTAAVAGSPTGVAAALTALAFAGVPGGRVCATQIGRDD